MALDPQLLFRALAAAGVSGFAGVPCSILDPLIIEAERSQAVDYLSASVEGEAVSAAAGMWLAGGLGAALMQNSGLGNAINPLASLAIPYRIPLLLVVSWRGEPGREDAVHHHPMGAATPGLFDLFDVPTTVLRENSDLEACAREAVESMRKASHPAALIVPRGLFAKSASPDAARPAPALGAAEAEARDATPARFGSGAPLASRSEVLAVWLDRCGGERAVSTTGYMSRELASHGHADRHFPMQGSMGFASAIALGVARRQPQQPISVLDGDGALIMRLGSLATIGAFAPAGFTHIVIDNGTYASTGGQRTLSPGVDFACAALACGYAAAGSCHGRDGLETALDWALDYRSRGPVLLSVAVDEREAAGLSRPDRTPAEIAHAFRAAQTAQTG